MGEAATMSNAHYESDFDSVVSFPSKTASPAHADQLDKAGQTILQLVQKAAGVADENSRHALGMAQKLSDQVRAAEDRIADLEAQVASHQERAERAEQWLHRVYTEIEDRFLRQNDERHSAPVRAQGGRRRTD